MNTERRIRRQLLVSFLALSTVIIILGAIFANRTALRFSHNNATQGLIAVASLYLVKMQDTPALCEAPPSPPSQALATPISAETNVFLVTPEGQAIPLSQGALPRDAISLEDLPDQGGSTVGSWRTGLFDTSRDRLMWAAYSISDIPGCTVLAQGIAPRASDMLTGKPAIWFLITSLAFLWFIIWFSAVLAYRINRRLKDQNALALAQTLRLEETKRALALEQERGSMRSQFLAVTSHQFKTPLASIIAAADVLEKHGSKLNEHQRSGRVTKIRNQVSRLNEMVNGILEMSRMSTVAKEANFEEVRIDQLVNELANDQDDISAATHPIERTLAPLIATVEPTLFRQTVENLISNAVKYTPDGGKITLQLNSDSDNFCLRVTDSGIGIPEAERDSLFAPFKRASNVGELEGTGIGLAIVDECISLHGGQVSVVSEPDKGTTFTLTLPKSQPPPLTPNQKHN